MRVAVFRQQVSTDPKFLGFAQTKHVPLVIVGALLFGGNIRIRGFQVDLGGDQPTLFLFGHDEVVRQRDVPRGRSDKRKRERERDRIDPSSAGINATRPFGETG